MQEDQYLRFFDMVQSHREMNLRSNVILSMEDIESQVMRHLCLRNRDSFYRVQYTWSNGKDEDFKALYHSLVKFCMVISTTPKLPYIHNTSHEEMGECSIYVDHETDNSLPVIIRIGLNYKMSTTPFEAIGKEVVGVYLRVMGPEPQAFLMSRAYRRAAMLICDGQQSGKEEDASYSSILDTFLEILEVKED